MENFLIDKKPFLPSPQKNAKKQSEAITKRFFVYMATGMMLGAIVLGVFAILGKHYISGYIVVTFVFSTVANFFLLAKGKTLAWSYRIQIFLSILFPFVFQYYCEGIVHSGAAMVWCVVALLGSMTFQKGGQAFGWLLFAILLTCWSAYVELDKFELNVLDPLTAVFFAMNLIMVTVLGFILAEFFMRTQRKLQVRLRERRKSAEKVSLELHRRNRDIEQSLAYAKHIQDNILPAHEKLGAAFYNHFVMYKPKEVVSGDFYWFGRLENKIIYANADCTGHGVPARL